MELNLHSYSPSKNLPEPARFRAIALHCAGTEAARATLSPKELERSVFGGRCSIGEHPASNIEQIRENPNSPQRFEVRVRFVVGQLIPGEFLVGGRDVAFRQAQFREQDVSRHRDAHGLEVG